MESQTETSPTTIWPASCARRRRPKRRPRPRCNGPRWPGKKQNRRGGELERNRRRAAGHGRRTLSMRTTPTLAAAETAIRDASDRFAEAAVRDIAAATAAYMDWVEASLRHYTLQVRVATVAPLVGLEATPGEQLSPPPSLRPWTPPLTFTPQPFRAGSVTRRPMRSAPDWATTLSSNAVDLVVQ